jgi:cytochrome c-type biogenesis protein CcmH/NrfG
MEARRDLDRAGYRTAEKTYVKVLAAEPHNAEALKGLAEALYRADQAKRKLIRPDRVPVG